MANVFQSVKSKKPQKSAFDLSHEVKLTGNMGNLIPILCQEVVPGDSFRVNSELFVRLAPLTSPVMHRVNVYTHYFFVPNRLIHKDWQDFITGGEDGMANVILPHIKITPSNKAFYNDFLKSSQLADYMGIPTINGDADNFELDFNALPFRAYSLIYNEFYRDQNLQPKIPFTTDSGLVSNIEASELLKLRKRGWEKDYFTSALPEAQKGAPVLLPLAGEINITGSTQDAIMPNNGVNDGTLLSVDNEYGIRYSIHANDGSNWQAKIGSEDGLPNGMKGDLSSATSTTVNDLREAFAIQRYMELAMRAGSRYIEQIKALFGVTTSDYRLQRPEYLGGGKSPIMISEVLQTSSSDDTTPQGNMAGHAYGVGNSNQFSKFFEEHGYIIGIMSVMPTTAYQQGIPRHYLRKDKFDFLLPQFVNLGEQEVKNQEVFFDFSDKSYNNLEFGYQQRYAEYRYNPSRVHGAFKDSLSFWHMGRKFESQPYLNAEFIESDRTTDIFAVTDENVDHLYIQIYNQITAVRPLPYMAEPGLIDH